ncbi:MAG: hypothetical protein HY303_20515, partial [Candidatus Wallbacteria bacterium]|nr:hypothetical protein [Candidatus Wallbacteria bacterium]
QVAAFLANPREQGGLDRLRAGEIELKGLFQGKLGEALGAVQQVLCGEHGKLVRTVRTRELLERQLRDGSLGLQGGVEMVVEEALTLPAIANIRRGGILICKGDLTIGGDLERGADSEPLTLVSLKGRVVVSPGVRKVDAFLISVEKTVVLPKSQDLAIRGGIAAAQMPADWIGTSGNRTVKFVPEFDPTAPDANAKYLRLCVAEDVQQLVGGAP